MRTLALCTLLLALSATPGPAAEPGSLPDVPLLAEAPPTTPSLGTRSGETPGAVDQPSGGASNLPEVRTRIVAEMVAAQVNGVASWMPAKYGPDYLAMRIPKGSVVQICGAGGCWEDAVVMDYGPSGRLHPERIADIAVGRWERICGVSRSRGLCRVTVDVVGPRMTLPPTDKEE